jgi:hypothetical protein
VASPADGKETNDIRSVLSKNFLGCDGPGSWGDYALKMEKYLRPIMNACAGYSPSCDAATDPACRRGAPAGSDSISLHKLDPDLYPLDKNGEAVVPAPVRAAIAGHDSHAQVDCMAVLRQYQFYAQIISSSPSLYAKRGTKDGSKLRDEPTVREPAAQHR